MVVRRIVLFAAVSLAVVALLSCGGSASGGGEKQPEGEAQRRADSLSNLKRQTELDSLKAEFEQLKNRPRPPHPIEVATPCSEYSRDGDGFVAGFGMSKPQSDQKSARTEAQQAAILDIASRVVMGAVSISSNGMDESKSEAVNRLVAESEAVSRHLAEKVISKYAEAVCVQLGEDAKTGGYIEFRALKIPLSEEVKAEIKAELEAARKNQRGTAGKE